MAKKASKSKPKTHAQVKKSGPPPQPEGSICHVEVPAPDMKKAVAFYGKLFGWKFTPMPGTGTYTLFQTGTVGGGLAADMEVAEKGVNLILKVENIDAKLRAIEASGGKTVQGKTKISADHGYFALFKDPNGVRMGVWSKNG
ncbi:MAG: VOC family protein [Planctomycetes bacterium]|nr:VOC family protein [Planctomycetota bacterium]